MKIKSLDHLVITTQDLEQCLAFYGEVLDMEIRQRGGRYSLCFGSQKINIHKEKAEFLPAAAHVTYGSQDLCLIAEGSITEIYEEIKRKGYPVEVPPCRRNGALGPMQSIYLRDPDGNLVEISSYGEGGCRDNGCRGDTCEAEATSEDATM